MPDLKPLICLLLTVVLTLLLGGCLQVQLYGPVSGSAVQITLLRDGTPVQEGIEAYSRDFLIELLGEPKWEELGPQLRLWLLGVFQPEQDGLQDELLYLVRASGGENPDADRDGTEDAVYSPIAGSWHAIVSGAQLKAAGAMVSPLTEAAYQWLMEDLPELSDAQVFNNLDRAAVLLVEDVDENGVVDANDLLHWSRLHGAPSLRANTNLINQLGDAIAQGASADAVMELATQLIPLEVSFDEGLISTSPAAVAALLQGLPLQQFYQQSYRMLLLRHPEWIVELGEEQHYGLRSLALNNVSDDYARETYRVIEVILQQLLDYEAEAEAEDPVAFATYRWYLEDWLAQEPFLLFSYPASSFITAIPRQTLFFFTDIHPLASAADASNYVARLGLVAEKIDQLRVNVVARAERGIIEPAITMEFAIDGIRQIARTRAASTSFYQHFSAELEVLPGMAADEAAQLRESARASIENSLIPAYQRLLDAMNPIFELAPEAIGFSQFAGGSDFYRYALRHHTATELTADQIHQIGLDNLQRLHAEIRSVASTLGYSTALSLPELFARVAVDGGTRSNGAILDTYEAILDAAYSKLGEAFEVLPQQELTVIGGEFGGFYVAGSFDGSRPGAFFASTVGEQPFYDMPSLAYHEGVPGHHLQIALAQEQAALDFQRVTTFTAFTEGWALYAERLAFELGWYDGDDYGNLGRLRFEAIRAARLVVDTGIHHLGWSWQQAVDSYSQNIGSSEGEAQGAVARFMRWPGQATAYMLGMNKILELRQFARDAQGSDFDLGRFHNQVLSNGSLPLSVLDDHIRDP